MEEQEAIDEANKLYKEKLYNQGAAYCEDVLPKFSESKGLLSSAILLNRDAANYIRAIELCKSAIKLYPRIAWYWMELANNYYYNLEYEEARDAIETAQEFSTSTNDTKWTWRYSEKIYFELNEHNKQAEALHELVNVGVANKHDLEKLGRAYHNQGEYYEALIWYRKAIAQGERSLALSNIGAVYMTDEISQDADAADALRRKLEICESDFAHKRYEQTKAKLLPLGEKAKEEFTHLKWNRKKYEHYVNPFEFFGLDPYLDGETIVKRSPKLRKQMCQEADLDGGYFDFNGREFTKDEINRLADELKDPEIRDYHRVIYDNPTFHNFLRKGDINHFLFSEDYFPKETLEFLDNHPEFRTFLTAPFSKQYSSLLCSVIDHFFKKATEVIDFYSKRTSKYLQERANKNGSLKDEKLRLNSYISLFEILFDGRRWISEDDEDSCFLEAYRRIEDKMSLVYSLFDRLSSKAIKRRGFLDAIEQTEIIEFINFFPRYFAPLQQEFVIKSRQLAIKMANMHGDEDSSKAILTLCRKLQFRDQVLMEQVQEDLKTIDELISEQRKYEVHFKIGKKPLKITRDFFQFDDKKINLEEIDGIKIGQTVNADSGYLSFMIEVRSGEEIVRAESSSYLRGAEQKRVDELLILNREQLIASANYIVPQIAEKIVRGLEIGKEYSFGTLRLKDGVFTIKKKRFFKEKTYTIPLSNVNFKIDGSEVLIKDKSGQSPSLRLDTRTHENAVVLPFLA